MTITYAKEGDLPVADYLAVIGSTYMAQHRPLANPDRIARMLSGANLVVTARDKSGDIVGLGRGISDGAWVCYLADLAVRDGWQRRGIGTGLISTIKAILGPEIGIVLISYPQALAYYRKIGLGETSAFFIDRTDRS